MATLVNLCLQNQIDLPYYRLFSEEVCLYLGEGKLLDERMKRLFQSFDGFIESKLQGDMLTEEQMLVLSYLIKSEWKNEKLGYTILLTPDNNHFDALLGLKRAELITEHPASTAFYPIYLANRVFLTREYRSELRLLFGTAFDSLDQTSKQVLGVVYRFNQFSKHKVVSAKQVSFSLWYEVGDASEDIQLFDAFYRKVRHTFNKLVKGGFVAKQLGTRGYLLEMDFL